MRLELFGWSIKVKKKRLHKRRISNVADRSYDKVFVIGFNKTGTTTVETTLRRLGFAMGNQAVAEVLSAEWGGEGYPDKIIRFCKTAEAFQDVPFSMPGMYRHLDEAFPGSKFILTKRDSAEQYYESLTKFHSKLFSTRPGQLPSEQDLAKALIGYEGMLLDNARSFTGYPEVPLYDKDAYIQRYEKHLDDVREHFSNRKSDLLEINVSKPGEFDRFIKFLEIETDMKEFPWENKT